MAANHFSLQKPPTPVTLALSETVNGWWIGVSKACAACKGRLIVDPPVHPELGSLRCLNCGREVAEVVAVRRAPFVPRMVVCPRDGYRHSEMARCPRCVNREALRRSRARTYGRLCTNCNAVVASPGHTRCPQCRYSVEKARKERAG